MILKTKNLSKSYFGKKIVNDLSFHIKEGEIVGLLGPNGAGKTTAFYMTIGLIRPDKGQVFFMGKDVTKKSIDQRAKMGMGYLAQEPSIFRHLTVEENILCILETLPLTKNERKERSKALLKELHLEKLSKNQAVTLSGGERRRLEITRSLITQPSLLLLDEPFANIDPKTIHEVKELIFHLKSKNISILITDHNAREVSSIVDRTYLMQEGTVIQEGTIDELITNKEAKATYFGENFKL